MITEQDLYTLPEKEVIEKIRNCEDKRIEKAFTNFQSATTVYESDKEIEDKYCICVDSKRRD